MAAVRVLVVEDHATVAERIGEGLRDAGLAVDVVYDGAAALERAGDTGYDVVVLDRDLPVVHGDRVCRSLAAVRDGPRILMLTAAAGYDRRRFSRSPLTGPPSTISSCPARRATTPTPPTGSSTSCASTRSPTSTWTRWAATPTGSCRPWARGRRPSRA
jgi:CheY-like chemotaxis protein